MTNSSHRSELLRQEVSNDGPDLTYGVASGLLIAIPLWVLIGVVLVFTIQQCSIEETGSLAFIVAAVVETVLVRYAFRSFWPKPGRSEGAAPRLLANGAHNAVMSTEDMLRLIAASSAAKLMGRLARVQRQHSTLRQTASFAALAIAFLSYYFVDVSLQIAKLNSVTVFVAVTPLLKAAT